TGYIGGAVTSRLLAHPRTASFDITALVRSEDKAAKLRPLGVKTVIGSYSDIDQLENLASEADILFSTVDCDDLTAMQANLRGLKRRYEATGQRPILIHTVREFVDRDRAAEGAFLYQEPYTDVDIPKIESLPNDAWHRNVDLEVVKADADGYVKTYIIMPGAVWGIPTGRVADSGAQHMYSMLLPWLVQAAIKRSRGGFVGLGKNLWPHVEVNDTADLYIVLLDSIFSDPHAATSGREGYYIAENGEFDLYDIAKAIGVAAQGLGLIKDSEPTSFTDEELQAQPKLLFFGTHCHCRADRSRSIGWAPVKTTAGFFASVRPEVEAVAKASTAVAN
ncbi:NAD(P)-binding protein, partial [Athelia psychrophila]